MITITFFQNREGKQLGFSSLGLADAENLPDLLNQYVYFFNNFRPAAALGYKSPVQYKTELGFL